MIAHNVTLETILHFNFITAEETGKFKNASLAGPAETLQNH